MITIALTYRNRDLRIVKNCLDSLNEQSSSAFKVVIVDYGSSVKFSEGIAKLVEDYSFIKLIQCPVKGQLWNKSRAINIALKQTTTPYFLVGDIDMLFSNNFVSELKNLTSETEITYFQVGFLDEEESKHTKLFNDYTIKHTSSEEATGITLYPTIILKSINGYDEFYHGWGAEDTDVHARLLNGGYKVKFYDNEILILHQWHPKVYRSLKSKEPYHSYLEKINHQYLQKIISAKKIKANTTFNWGELPIKEDFSIPTISEISITNQKCEVDAFLYGFMNTIKSEKISLKIVPHNEYNSIKNNIKRALNKKAIVCYDFTELNDLLLSNIIAHFRSNQYVYEWDKEMNIIKLSIVL